MKSAERLVKNKFWLAAGTLILIMGMGLPMGIRSAAGQPSEPPQASGPPPVCLPGEPCRDEGGRWVLVDDDSPDGAVLSGFQSTGGPDDYGYTWDDSVTYAWVYATNGADVGFSGSSPQLTGPIALPFNFTFYGHTYSEIYIASAGYLTFDEQAVVMQGEIPHPGWPNAVIAPYWAPLAYAAAGPTARAYYKTGGSAPNRYFAVEWYRVLAGDDVYTFEVLLYENGDILFQYQDMAYNNPVHLCGSEGIEDADGLDGLAYYPFCYPVSDLKAVRFYKPAALVRTRVYPLYDGQLTQFGQTNTFTFTVGNTGDFGPDTYDLTVASAWAVSLYGPDGITPLDDTDGDTRLDTGAIPPGEVINIIARVTAPDGLSPGAENTASITVRSSLNTTIAKTVRLETTIPAQFAQAYREQDPGSVNLDLNWAAPQLTLTVTPGEDGHRYEPAVVQTTDQHFVTVWAEWQETGGLQGYRLLSARLNQYGQVIRPQTVLTSLEPGVDFFSDGSIAAAAAPDGRIGVAWYRLRRIDAGGLSFYNYNIWFAVLNPDGSLAVGPVNLTQQTAWQVDEDDDLRKVYAPTLAASSDNRFWVSWEQYYRPTGAPLYEIYSTLLAADGSVVMPITRMASGIPGSLRYRHPSVLALSGSRFLLAYDYLNYAPFVSSVKYRVYDSSGEGLVSERDTGFYGLQIDAAQLSGGNALIAADARNYIHYAVINGSSLIPPVIYGTLQHPSDLDESFAVAVAADETDHAILTWQDGRGQYLYYTLVDASGTAVSGPAIYRTAPDSQAWPRLETSATGYSLTTNAWTPPADVDGLTGFSAGSYGAQAGGAAVVGLRYANQGLTPAASPVLTLTLGDGLSYLSDTSGLSAAVNGSEITWNLPDLDFGAHDQFTVYIGLPAGAPLGTTYPLSLALESEGPEADATNNADTAEVVAARQMWLPAIQR